MRWPQSSFTEVYFGYCISICKLKPKVQQYLDYFSEQVMLQIVAYNQPNDCLVNSFFSYKHGNSAGQSGHAISIRNSEISCCQTSLVVYNVPKEKTMGMGSNPTFANLESPDNRHWAKAKLKFWIQCKGYNKAPTYHVPNLYLIIWLRGLPPPPPDIMPQV